MKRQNLHGRSPTKELDKEVFLKRSTEAIGSRLFAKIQNNPIYTKIYNKPVKKIETFESAEGFRFFSINRTYFVTRYEKILHSGFSKYEAGSEMMRRFYDNLDEINRSYIIIK